MPTSHDLEQRLAQRRRRLAEELAKAERALAEEHHEANLGWLRAAERELAEWEAEQERPFEPLPEPGLTAATQKRRAAVGARRPPGWKSYEHDDRRNSHDR